MSLAQPQPRVSRAERGDFFVLTHPGQPSPQKPKSDYNERRGRKTKGRMTMGKMLAIVAVLGLSVTGSVSASSNAGSAVTINYRQSSCAQMPFAETGQVRFFVQLYNSSSRTAAFAKNIRFLWLRSDGWKDSWLNSISGGSLKVPAGRGKRYYADFGSDPTKLIVRCALRIGSSGQLHFVKVLS